MRTNLLKSINLVRRGSRANLNLFRYTAMVIILLMLGVSDAWAGGSTKKDDPEHTSNGAYMSAKTNSNAEGLVYISTSSSANPGVSDYYAYAPIGMATAATNTKSIEAVKCHVKAGSMEGPHATYYWAKPMRGYRFDKWTGMLTKSSRSNYNPINTIETTNGYTDVANWDGVKDIVYASAGLTQCTYTRVTANFAKLGTSMVTYVRPVGSSYTVSYSYLEPEEITRTYEWTDQDVKNSNSYTDYRFKQTDVSYSVASSDDRDKEEKFYDGEKVRLVTTVTNFEGWYANDAFLSSSKDYTYTIPNSPNAPETPQTIQIEAKVKSATIGTAAGDLGPTLEAFSVEGLESTDFTITVPVTTLGTWVASDFNVAFAEQTNPARGDISKGTVAYSAGILTIPFTYNPSSFGNTNVQVTVSPAAGSAYGNTVQFNILASANQLTNYEACIIENSVQINQGYLADMVAQANTMDSKPTVQLAKNVTISSPLSLQQSMTFDLNDKTLTSTGASAFSIAAQGIDVQIIDNGYSHLGTIATSSAQSGNVSVVGFTQKAKLTMQGGTLSATNTGTGSAYGIDVTQGSTFYMTNGQLTVTGVSEAHGVHVATASDYATLNGGSITVTAPASAYGVWSAGQSNVTDATIAAETTTGANAYGIYVNGGVSTLTTNTVTATAKTTGAYGAYVNAGRLNGNGGSFAAEAVTSGVYGVHVQAGAEAMLQMNAVVTAEATGASGTSVFGVNNLGTVSLTNVSVTSTSPTTAATAVNTATSASAVSTTIDGGTYRATAAGGTAYGLHHQYGSLSIDGGTFRGVGDGNTVYGIRAIESATIANATITGETFSTGNSAYGISGEGEGKTITLTNCAITGRSNTSKAYAIYADANMAATNCTLTATTLGSSEAYGLYAKSGTNSLNHCNATVAAQSIQAYGIYHKAGSLSIDGGEYEVTISQADAGESKMYGIYNESDITTEVQNAEFDVRTTSSYSQKVYGAYINGTLISSNSTYAVRAQTSVYGIYGTGASTLTLSGNTIGTTVSDGTISYGVYAKKDFSISGDEVRAVGNKTSVYALFFDATNSVGTVTGGKFYAMGDGTTAFGSINGDATKGNVQLIGGVYSAKVNLERYAATGYQVFNIDDTEADFAAGYRYVLATSNPSPYVCKIVGGNRYAKLEAALQYTKDNEGTYTIVMTQPYTLPEGDYELPKNVTLLIPYNAEQSEIIGAEPKRIVVAGVLSEHLCLRMAEGAHLNVNGTIEVGGEMYCSKSGRTSYNASPYARIHMDTTSLIQLNSGARLYAWGYISGTGEITVKSDAEVHEMFHIEDMKSMPEMAQNYTDLGNANEYKYFPLNRYYIQNVEVPTKYYYNARLITAMSIYHGSKLYGDLNVKLIGLKSDKALFAVTSTDENAWVRKSYDAKHDYQVWEVNSSVELGSLQLDLGNFELGIFSYPIKFNSAQYILPLTSNMKVHVKDGNFSITQDAQILPGVQVEVNKTATLTINEGIKVYVFDKDQWPWTSQYTVVFSPGWENGTKPSRTVYDAALNIHGKIDVQGYLYTSNKGTETSKTDGANIFSTNPDAGTVEYNKHNVPTSQTTVTLMTSTTATKVVTMDPAKLKNGSGVTPAYTETSGTSSGVAFMYYEDKWQDSYTNGCFQILGSTVYAKPSGYVALKKSQTVSGKLTGVEETNHTYLTADDKILILMDDCQWWEVIATSDPAVFECEKEGYEGFYYYDNTSSKWKLKTVTVTFYQNETGSTVLKNIVTDYNGIPDQSVIATNPSKGTTAEYTYSFYGWKSSVTGDTIKWTDQLEVATADMSYRPVFTATKRNYTITLIDANNGETVYLEVPYGETPSYSEKKDATAQYTYTFEGWSPAFTTVTGTATYTATWTSTVNEYNITWKNGNEILEVDENQPYGTVTAYNGETPTKDADNNYAYAFSGWHNSLTNAPRVNNETVTGEITYTALYNTTPRYAITFNNYDGEPLVSTIYTQGETPAYDGVPARKRDDNGYFRFKGWKDGNGTDYAANAVLPAVTKKETYTAQYDYVTDFFTITLKNVDGNGATWSGKFGEGSTPFYNPNDDDVPVTPTKASADPHYSWVFNGWSLTDGGAKLDPTPAVTADATYWALFTQVENKYTVSFAANNDAWGIVSRDDVKEVPYGTAITVNGNTLTVNGKTITATPAAEDAQYMYRFERWESVPGTVTSETNIQAVFKAYVATVEAGGNTTYHTTIADAIETANGLTNNPTVTMCKNASTTSEIVITKTMTIDLNGKKISSTQTTATTAVFKINASGKTVTIKDSGTNGEINHTASVSGYMYGLNLYAGSLNIESGTIYAKNNAANRAYGIYTEGTASSITISGSAVVKAESSTSPFGLYSSVSNSLTMNGGTVIANGSGSRGIYMKGTTNLTNATITVTGSSSHTIFAVSGNMTINSGTYTTTGGGESYCIFHRNNAITINGGYFNTPNKLYKRDTNGTYTGTITLKGGYYSNDTELAAKCASGYQVFALTAAEKAEVGSDYNYKVTAIYTLTFNVNSHGIVPESQQIEKGKKATEPAAPTAEGYTFGGWYKEAGCSNAWDFNTDVVDANTTLFAKWTPVNYTISYTLNGGSATNPENYNIETATFTLNNPTQTGYDFVGWTGSNGSTPQTTVSVTVGSTGNKSYTANWTPTNYTISYELDGGSVTPANPENYNIETATFTLNNPTKVGYTFAGWTGSNGSTPQKPVSVTIGSTGNKSYTANWTINHYDLTVLSDKDETFGTVTGSGTYDYGTKVTITATPNLGCKFVEWNDHNTSASREVTVTADRTYTATFDYDVANYTVKHWKQNIANDEYTEVTGDAYVDSGTIGEETEAVANNYPGFTTQDIEQQIIAVGGTTVVNIYYNRNPYTITFNSNGGSAVASITQKYESSVTAPDDPTRDGYEFAGWSPDVPETMPIDGATCVAQWNINSTLDIEEHETVTISENAEVVTTIVHEGGELEVASEKTLTTDVLIVEASASNSGQITGAGNVEVTASTGKAYFDLTLNTPARHWHAFGVPWAVDLTTDPLTEVETGRTLTLGSHYEIVYYDTHTRATQGPNANCWKYLKHYDQVGQPIDEMTPGQGYMIAFTCSVQTVRFVKKAGAPVIYNEAVTVSAEGSGDNQGINALANPMAYHATLNAGPKVGYVHDGGEIGSDGYEEYDIDSKSFIVGKAVYIQVRSDATVEVEQSDAEQISKLLAPARRKVVTDKEYLSLGDYYHVSISSATINGGSVYVLPEEDKEDKYVVGHDLAKFGMSTKKPQIWVNRYGVNLGLNTVAPINETAEFSVNLYAPTAGDYTITNNQSPMTNDEYIVYLTQNGEAIWNLSDAPYMTSLPAGVNKTYGLRLTARKAPEVATGVDEAVVDAKNEIRKVLIDEKVFIIREGNVYSIDGQLVK